MTIVVAQPIQVCPGCCNLCTTKHELIIKSLANGRWSPGLAVADPCVCFEFASFLTSDATCPGYGAPRRSCSYDDVTMSSFLHGSGPLFGLLSRMEQATSFAYARHTSLWASPSSLLFLDVCVEKLVARADFYLKFRVASILFDIHHSHPPFASHQF